MQNENLLVLRTLVVELKGVRSNLERAWKDLDKPVVVKVRLANLDAAIKWADKQIEQTVEKIGVLADVEEILNNYLGDVSGTESVSVTNLRKWVKEAKGE